MSDDEGGRSGRRKSGRSGRRARRRKDEEGSSDEGSDKEEDLEQGRKKTTEKTEKSSADTGRGASASTAKTTQAAKPAEETKGRKATVAAGSDGKVDPTDIAAVTKMYEPVTDLIDQIKTNTGKLKKLDTGAHDEKQRQKVNKQLDGLVDETTKRGLEVKTVLSRLKQKNFEWKSKPGNEARENLYKKSAIDFQNAFTDYKEVTEGLKKKLVDDKKRQLRTMAESVNQPLSEEKIDIIIERGQADSVIQQVMMEDNARLYDVVSDVEDRHKQVLHLESQVHQVFELFKDLATLVDIQQESLDLIDNHIQGAKVKVEKGEKELEEAREYQKAARRKKCYIMMCGLAILVVLVGGVLLGTLNKS